MDKGWVCLWELAHRTLEAEPIPRPVSIQWVLIFAITSPHLWRLPVTRLAYLLFHVAFPFTINNLLLHILLSFRVSVSVKWNFVVVARIFFGVFISLTEFKNNLSLLTGINKTCAIFFFWFYEHSLQSLMDDWQLKAVTVVRLERLRFNTFVRYLLSMMSSK